MPKPLYRWTAALSLVALAVVPLRALADPLTLDQAVRRAVDRHPALLAARASSDAAREGVGQAESYWWPRLTLNGSYRYSQPVPELTVDTGVTPPGATQPMQISRQVGTANNASIGLQAGWRALDWGVRSEGVRAAEAGVRAAQDDEALRAADIAYSVRVAYLTALFYDSAEEITERSLATARRELLDREARRDSGLGSDVDVASASARVAELDARLVDLQSRGEVAIDTLRILIGLDPDAPLELVDDFDAVAARPGESELEDHPAMRRFAALSEALERQADAVDRSFWPTLDLFANVNYQYPATFVDTEEAGFTFNAGLSLTWELFDGWLRDHREAELRDRSSATLHVRDANEEDIERSVLDAESRQRAAVAQLEAARRQLEAAETYLRVARTAYDSGTGTALDVLSAEGAVDGARLAELQARLQQAVAAADLLRARGESVGSDRGEMPPNGE